LVSFNLKILSIAEMRPQALEIKNSRNLAFIIAEDRKHKETKEYLSIESTLY
jgi:hypothetical protein